MTNERALKRALAAVERAVPTRPEGSPPYVPMVDDAKAAIVEKLRAEFAPKRRGAKNL
jgi:hypothetical protein